MSTSKRTYRLLDNPFATIFTGPGSDKHDSGREVTTWTKAGNCDTHWKNGGHTRITQGPSAEVTNVNPDQILDEGVSKYTRCKNGDYVVIVDGNIKFKAKNIIFEAEGVSPNGNIDIVGNGNVTMVTNETVRIQGGEIQVAAEKDVILDANGFLNMIGDMKNAGHPSIVGTITSYLGGSWASTLSSVSNQIRGLK
jgi:hypothetical protein